MSKLTTQDTIAIATNTRKAQAALAFRMSGMATVLTEGDRQGSIDELQSITPRKGTVSSLIAAARAKP